MINVLDWSKENILAFQVKGKITKEEIERLQPLIHKIIDKDQKVHFYMEIDDFSGYKDIGALWADLKIDVAHISHYGKIAVVGDKKWEEWATKATGFFTNSEARFFEPHEKEEAKQWIQE